MSLYEDIKIGLEQAITYEKERNMNNMTDFQYSLEYINKLIEKNNLQKVCMQGCKKDLEQLKPVIEEVYDKYVFYLSYWKTECAYFGYNWDEDDGTLENQAIITDGIIQKFQEIYALILSGLGEKYETNNI